MTSTKSPARSIHTRHSFNICIWTVKRTWFAFLFVLQWRWHETISAKQTHTRHILTIFIWNWKKTCHACLNNCLYTMTAARSKHTRHICRIFAHVHHEPWSTATLVTCKIVVGLTQLNGVCKQHIFMRTTHTVTCVRDSGHPILGHKSGITHTTPIHTCFERTHVSWVKNEGKACQVLANNKDVFA